ncbi:MAG: acyltransferase family protein [Gemmobacter sp.]|nr:acyltransferase family protein [Gemmobacter sp.]
MTIFLQNWKGDGHEHPLPRPWQLQVIANSKMSTNYRPEIDGLRAVAVIPVILFHAGVTGFGGGFIGVDVFFVISGYLITSIILADIQSNTFSIARFYERRARRILPALTLVMAACIPFAWVWMTPQELVDFGQSLVATALFGSNILFWRESGYFSAAAELKPLLHTWSLGVEEQFYLLFPILLLLLKPLSRKALAVLLLAVVISSIALAQWASANAVSANFYLLPTRIWELLAGALVAIGNYRRPIANEALSFFGLLLIIVAVVLFNASTPNPSLWTLLPVGGTMLLLGFGSKDTLAGRLLSIKPLVAIGLISYSAYLWHQPLLAFYRIRVLDNPEGPALIAILAATFVLAALTWKLVEQPCRSGWVVMRSKSRVFSASFFSICFGVFSGMVLMQGEGWPNRIAPFGGSFASIDPNGEILAPNYGLAEACDQPWPIDLEECSTSDSERSTIALWGDSYAMHLAPVLSSSETRQEFTQLTLSQCGPLYELAIQGTLRPWQECMDHNRRVTEWIFSNPDIELIIISSPFEHLSRPIFTSDGLLITDPDLKLEAVINSFRGLVDVARAAGKRVVVVSPPPRTGTDLGICVLRSRLMALDEGVCDFQRSIHDAHSASSDELLSAIDEIVPVIRLDDLICNDDQCPATIDGRPLYRDGGHLSIVGGERLGERIDLMGLALSASLGNAVRSPSP